MHPTYTIDEALKRIRTIDLEPIVFKLVNPDPGDPSISLEEADERAELYRKFLALNLMYPHLAIVPTREIDSVWHNHILDTVKYFDDCQAVFGFFLHHFPYFGLRGAEDEARWKEQAANTRALFKAHFEIEISVEAAASCLHTGCSACQSGDGYGHRERPRPTRMNLPA